MCWDKRPRIRVSPLTPLILALFVVVASPVLLWALLGAAILHEGGHLAALRGFGGRISEVKISPLGAEMTVMHSERLSYGAELLVTLAGPAVNLLLAVTLGLIGRRWEGAYVLTGAQLVLGLFNLLPIRPLDGGRMLWLSLAWRTDPFLADRVSSAVGVLFAAALLLCGAAVFYRTGRSPFLLLSAVGLLASSLREKGLVKSLSTR